MILTDTGPLVALLDKDDAQHLRCVAAARSLRADLLLTTWPCFTEAMYLLGAVGGYSYQAALWHMRLTGRLAMHEPAALEAARMAALMEKYQNVPMDLADASLVTAAETLDSRQVFSLDSDFFIYRLSDGTAFTLLPGP